MRPTVAPIRFVLEVHRMDQHGCRVTLLDDGDDGEQTRLFEVVIECELVEDAQRQALKTMARHLQWFLSAGDA